METTLGEVATNLEWVGLGARALGTVVPAMAPLGQLAQLGGVVRHVSTNLVKSDNDLQFFNGLELYDFAKGGNRLLHLRDAGVFYNLPLPALCDERRNLDVIFVYDTSGDLHEMQEGTPMIGSELAKFKRYPQFAGKRFPQELRNEASFRTKMDALYRKEKLLAVFNDPRQRGYNPDEITLVYIPTISHPAIEELTISPTERFGTFKLQYDQAESQSLMDYSKALAEKTEQEMKDVIKARTAQMQA